MKYQFVVALIVVASCPARAEWMAYSETDRLDGKKHEWIATTTKQAEQTPQRGSSAKIPAEFRISCQKGKTIAWIASAGTLLAGSTTKVAYRFDDKSPRVGEHWYNSTDNSAIGKTGPAGIAFARLAAKAKMLFVRVTDNVFGQSEITFDLEGLSEKLWVIEKSCKWPSTAG